MLTKYLAKVMGLWILLTVLGMFITPQASLATINALFTNPPVLWVTGIFTMLVGLIVVVAHNRWSGGPIPVIVTLYGWIALLKGLTFVWLPSTVQTAAWQALHFDSFYYAYLAVALIIGAYLTYGGFMYQESAPPPTGNDIKGPTPNTWPTVPRR